MIPPFIVTAVENGLGSGLANWSLKYSYSPIYISLGYFYIFVCRRIWTVKQTIVSCDSFKIEIEIRKKEVHVLFNKLTDSGDWALKNVFMKENEYSSIHIFRKWNVNRVEQSE